MNKYIQKISYLIPAFMVFLIGATVGSDGTITLDPAAITGTSATINKIGGSLLTMLESFRQPILGLIFVLGIIGFLNRKLG